MDLRLIADEAIEAVALDGYIFSSGLDSLEQIEAVAEDGKKLSFGKNELKQSNKLTSARGDSAISFGNANAGAKVDKAFDLTAHDKRAHKDGYKEGSRCKFRDTMAKKAEELGIPKENIPGLKNYNPVGGEGEEKSGGGDEDGTSPEPKPTTVSPNFDGFISAKSALKQAELNKDKDPKGYAKAVNAFNEARDKYLNDSLGTKEMDSLSKLCEKCDDENTKDKVVSWVKGMEQKVKASLANGKKKALSVCQAVGITKVIEKLGETGKGLGIRIAQIADGKPTPAEPTEPAKPDEPTEPAKPAEPTEPAKPDEPTEPAKPDEPTEPAKPDEPTEPAKPAEPTEPAKPDEPTEPAKPAEPTEPAKPAEPTEPAKPAEPTEPAKPNADTEKRISEQRKKHSDRWAGVQDKLNGSQDGARFTVKDKSDPENIVEKDALKKINGKFYPIDDNGTVDLTHPMDDEEATAYAFEKEDDLADKNGKAKLAELRNPENQIASAREDLEKELERYAATHGKNTKAFKSFERQQWNHMANVVNGRNGPDPVSPGADGKGQESVEDHLKHCKANPKSNCPFLRKKMSEEDLKSVDEKDRKTASVKKAYEQRYKDGSYDRDLESLQNAKVGQSISSGEGKKIAVKGDDGKWHRVNDDGSTEEAGISDEDAMILAYDKDRDAAKENLKQRVDDGTAKKAFGDAWSANKELLEGANPGQRFKLKDSDGNVLYARKGEDGNWVECDENGEDIENGISMSDEELLAEFDRQNNVESEHKEEESKEEGTDGEKQTDGFSSDNILGIGEGTDNEFFSSRTPFGDGKDDGESYTIDKRIEKIRLTPEELADPKKALAVLERVHKAIRSMGAPVDQHEREEAAYKRLKEELESGKIPESFTGGNDTEESPEESNEEQGTEEVPENGDTDGDPSTEETTEEELSQTDGDGDGDGEGYENPVSEMSEEQLVDAKRKALESLGFDPETLEALIGNENLDPEMVVANPEIFAALKSTFDRWREIANANPKHKESLNDVIQATAQQNIEFNLLDQWAMKINESDDLEEKALYHSAINDIKYGKPQDKVVKELTKALDAHRKSVAQTREVSAGSRRKDAEVESKILDRDGKLQLAKDKREDAEKHKAIAEQLSRDRFEMQKNKSGVLDKPYGENHPEGIKLLRDAIESMKDKNGNVKPSMAAKSERLKSIIDALNNPNFRSSDKIGKALKEADEIINGKQNAKNSTQITEPMEVNGVDHESGGVLRSSGKKYAEVEDSVLEQMPKVVGAPDHLEGKARTVEEALAKANINIKSKNITQKTTHATVDFELDKRPDSSQEAELMKAMQLGLEKSGLSEKAAAKAMEGTSVSWDGVHNRLRVRMNNDKKTQISLHDVVSSEAYKKAKSSGTLVAPIGIDEDGNPVMIDFEKINHMLICGATGTGKGYTAQGILTALAKEYGPDDLQLMVIDPKKTDYAGLKGLPHMLKIGDHNEANNMFEWAKSELENRQSLFEKATEKYGKSIRNVKEYNAAVGDEKDENGSPLKMPRIVMTVDEFSNLMKTAGGVSQNLEYLAEKARSAGIHLILMTQVPDRKTITSKISDAVQGAVVCHKLNDASATQLAALQGMGDVTKQAKKGAFTFKGFTAGSENESITSGQASTIGEKDELSVSRAYSSGNKGGDGVTSDSTANGASEGDITTSEATATNNASGGVDQGQTSSVGGPDSEKSSDRFSSNEILGIEDGSDNKFLSSRTPSDDGNDDSEAYTIDQRIGKLRLTPEEKADPKKALAVLERVHKAIRSMGAPVDQHEREEAAYKRLKEELESGKIPESFSVQKPSSGESSGNGATENTSSKTGNNPSDEKTSIDVDALKKKFLESNHGLDKPEEVFEEMKKNDPSALSRLNEIIDLPVGTVVKGGDNGNAGGYIRKEDGWYENGGAGRRADVSHVAANTAKRDGEMARKTEIIQPSAQTESATKPQSAPTESSGPVSTSTSETATPSSSEPAKQTEKSGSTQQTGSRRVSKLADIFADEGEEKELEDNENSAREEMDKLKKKYNGRVTPEFLKEKKELFEKYQQIEADITSRYKKDGSQSPDGQSSSST